MTGRDPALTLLGPATLSAYLARLGVRHPVKADLATLNTLQAAHLRAVPFHNLALLAAAGRNPGLPAVSAAIEGALLGHGGTCHVLSPPFASLLRSLGFDAHLASASVGAPGDHLVVIVHLDGRRWLCDVANGHPYLRPFPVDPTPDSAEGLAEGLNEQTAYGWTFRIERAQQPKSTATHRVLRYLPDGSWKVVYTLSPDWVPYSAFEHIITEHHTRAGFGPFLTGLRAVRMTRDRLLCLRDCWLERHGIGPVGRRFVSSARAIGDVLERHFGLGHLPWMDALRTLETQTRKWWTTTNTTTLSQASVAQPAQIRILVSVGLMDRPGALWTLGQALLRDGLGSQTAQPGAGILAFDNSQDPACTADHAAAAAALSAAGLPTRVGSRSLVHSLHQRLLAAGLCADIQRQTRVDIATSRMIQVGLLADHFEQLSRRDESASLPHPDDANGPVVVWMLDDDLRFERLELTAAGLATKPLVDMRRTVDRLYREHPEVSVLIGGNTGCPPIPGFCFLHVQIRDLVAHIRSASQQDPDAPYRPGKNPRNLSDYYYDTSDSGDAHLDHVFDWEPESKPEGVSVRDALLSHLRSVAGLQYGQPATRLLTYQPDLGIAPTTARGGNALFFDLDALFAAPYVAIRLAQDVVSRRGDTIWAHLASDIPGVSVYQAPFPLHHVRRPGDGSGPVLAGAAGEYNLGRFILAQIGGLVLSRLVAARLRNESVDPYAMLEQRVRRVRDAFAAATEQIEQFDAAQYDRRTDLWWARTEEVEVRNELARVVEVLHQLKAGVLSCDVAAAMELQTAAENLAIATSSIEQLQQRWRSLWR